MQPPSGFCFQLDKLHPVEKLQLKHLYDFALFQRRTKIEQIQDAKYMGDIDSVSWF